LTLTPAAGIGCNDELAVSLALGSGETHAASSTRGGKEKDLKNLAAALARSFLLLIDISGEYNSPSAAPTCLVPLSPLAWTGCSRFLCSMSVHSANLLPVNRMNLSIVMRDVNRSA
jgi:hypothetical protein